MEITNSAYIIITVIGLRRLSERCCPSFAASCCQVESGAQLHAGFNYIHNAYCHGGEGASPTDWLEHLFGMRMLAELVSISVETREQESHAMQPASTPKA